MSNKTVLITNSDIPKSAVDMLSAKFDVKINDDNTRKGILSRIQGVDAIFWAFKTKLDNELLDAAGPNLKMVGTMSAGLDNFNIDELKKRKIKLSNTPNVLNDAVADIAVLLCLAAARRMHEGRKIIEQGVWPTGSTTQWMLGQDIKGSTVGIVGLGGIGQTILKRLAAFEVKKFLYTGHKEKPEGKQLGATFVSLDDLLINSDFVIAACPLTSETKGMFNDDAFNKMKNTAVFVNIGRGGTVDQPALIRALKEGKIFSAGLDVMTPEPLPPNDELVNLTNCVLIPHLGSATIRTRTAMAELAARNIIAALEGTDLLTPVC